MFFIQLHDFLFKAPVRLFTSDKGLKVIGQGGDQRFQRFCGGIFQSQGLRILKQIFGRGLFRRRVVIVLSRSLLGLEAPGGDVVQINQIQVLIQNQDHVGVALENREVAILLVGHQPVPDL